MDEPGEADASALTLTNPAAAVTTPVPPSPTTRGWTMLEELNDSLPGVPPPTAATPAAAPEKAPEPAPAAAGGTPSSRGWTMFMEAELQGKDESKPEPEAADPEFYDGQVTTDSGTVVAFAPTAAAPQARPRVSEPEAELSPGTEEMTSFGSRFRGAEAEPPSPVAEASAPQSPPDLPSFAGNSSFDFGGLTPPTKPQPEPVMKSVTPAPTNPPESVFATAEAAEVAGGGGSKVLIIVIVVLVIAAVAVMALTST
jgi:hypothetical protein